VPGFAQAAEVHLVETSGRLRAEQAARIPDAHWHQDVETLPHEAPLLLVANEFFDALPVAQFVRTPGGWFERMVGLAGGKLAPVAGPIPVDALVPAEIRTAPHGSIVEVAPAAAAVAETLAARLARQGGCALVIDYGYVGPATGDTLQAVSRHSFADPFDRPGECDLTAHVDFAALADAFARGGASAIGPVEQGEWLMSLGIAERIRALAARAADERQCELIVSALRRLTHPDEMGRLFKVLAAVGDGWPRPAGFSR
jgi:NADH dehydrogenase [ubiquinone] 1 alpha subcomplex assembly factor 7